MIEQWKLFYSLYICTELAGGKYNDQLPSWTHNVQGKSLNSPKKQEVGSELF